MKSLQQPHHFIGPRERREYLLGIIASLVGDKPLFPEPCKPIEFNPTHKLILCCSSVPKINDNGFAKRLQIVQFPQVFNEQGPSGPGRE